MSGGAPPGWRLHVHDELGSTQDAAMEAARCGEGGRLAIMARRQRAGRGRGGRVWEAPEGNLNLSVLLRPERPLSRPGHWALLAGVALHAGLLRLAPGARELCLKWPNDLMLAGGKLGGILIDTSVGALRRATWIVIGFGVNIAASPALEDRQTACLARIDPTISSETLAREILACLDDLCLASDEAVRREWLARAHAPGTALRVRGGAGWIEGVFRGVAEDGALLLDGHASPIYSGDTMLADEPTAPCC